jgi:hypothetical protein
VANVLQTRLVLRENDTQARQRTTLFRWDTDESYRLIPLRHLVLGFAAGSGIVLAHILSGATASPAKIDRHRVSEVMR